MPISLNIVQPTGVTATYHKATGGGYGAVSVTATVLSFLDSSHTDVQGFAPLAETQVDVSGILAVPAVAPTTGETFGTAFFGGLDAFLIEQQTLNADTALPPVNGVFFGGTVVA